MPYTWSEICHIVSNFTTAAAATAGHEQPLIYYYVLLVKYTNIILHYSILYEDNNISIITRENTNIFMRNIHLKNSRAKESLGTCPKA